MSGKRSKELRKKVFGDQTKEGQRKYSARLTDKEMREAEKKDGKIILKHVPCRITTGPRAEYQRLKKQRKRRRK